MGRTCVYYTPYVRTHPAKHKQSMKLTHKSKDSARIPGPARACKSAEPCGATTRVHRKHTVYKSSLHVTVCVCTAVYCTRVGAVRECVPRRRIRALDQPEHQGISTLFDLQRIMQSSRDFLMFQVSGPGDGS